MKFTKFCFLFVACIVAQSILAEPVYSTSGRVEKMGDKILLIGSVSSVGFQFTGTSCVVVLQSVDSWEHHNYVVFELDGKYLYRERIESTLTHLKIDATGSQPHILKIIKATEAANGSVLFDHATADNISAVPATKVKKIEFIGDSITCGMGNDLEIPCNSGEWFDQHNAYWAYGPIAGRELGCEVLLSSVSGIGMYRNWNDEHQEQAIMPDVYEKLYLDKNKAQPYDFAFAPDLVSICLGTNDLSEGDGKKPRLAFNPDAFVSNYIAFIKTVYRHSPKTRIVLLNSPMVNGTRDKQLVDCLHRVTDAFAKDKTHKPIALFEFKPMTPNGCGSHPDIADDKIMASQLTPFLKKLLDEK